MKKDVVKYEKVLNESEKILKELSTVLDKLEKNQQHYLDLKDYYGSEEYFNDVEHSNTTNQYDDIACGVLSEDAVYNVIGDSFQM